MALSHHGSLNPAQAEAVHRIEGPLLILAGAGSGKTRVITHRIAFMLKKGLPQSSILAVTFTNKAAREMLVRIRQLCSVKPRQLTACTFHAFGVRVLRESGHYLGYRSNFSIYDQTDKQSLIKEAARDMGFPRDKLDPQRLGYLFSRIKTGTPWDEYSEQYQDLFSEYTQRLKLFNAMDFDDLIIQPTRLMEEFPEIRQLYCRRYRYIMVDEFQDTSRAQYRLIKILAEESRNLCVVGDDDQSIYSWRGASVENIHRFERDFPERTVVKLEQNYRSTRTILKAANKLIANNEARKCKTLWSGLGEGEPIRVLLPEDEEQEGRLIADTIRSLAFQQKLKLGSFAVLVRANNLTRPLEEAFLRENLPYQVSGGTSFFQRKEIKDIVSYLRLLANADDDVNLLRIINTPRRGIGKRVLELIVETAGAQSCSLYSGASALNAAADSPLSGRLKEVVGEFVELIECYRDRFLNVRELASTLRSLVEEIDYWGYLNQEHPVGKTARWKYANVESLVDSLAAYQQDPDNLDPSLYNYLNRISLVAREDDQDRDGKDRINILTIHAAKGLEFDTVFIAGVEKGLIPHARALEEHETNIEEERRLFYVAITRAKRRLFLSACGSRKFRGSRRESEPSPFLDELPEDLLCREQEEEVLDSKEALHFFREMKNKYS